jgi:hypothetical protein
MRLADIFAALQGLTITSNPRRKQINKPTASKPSVWPFLSAYFGSKEPDTALLLLPIASYESSQRLVSDSLALEIMLAKMAVQTAHTRLASIVPTPLGQNDSPIGSGQVST